MTRTVLDQLSTESRYSTRWQMDKAPIRMHMIKRHFNWLKIFVNKLIKIDNFCCTRKLIYTQDHRLHLNNELRHSAACARRITEATIRSFSFLLVQ